jgi:hypothetical protein
MQDCQSLAMGWHSAGPRKRQEQQMTTRTVSMAVIGLLSMGAAQAVSLTSGGYTENFDSMGATGTAPPTDWRVLVGESGTLNTTWTNALGIIANGASGSVASMVAASGVLTIGTGPSVNNNNGYNAAVSVTTVSDRILATAPTQVSGAALELALSNATGSDFDAVNVSYDIVRFTAASSANELPGYRLFFSLGGNSWTNVAALNPTLTTVPNSAGVSPFTGTVSLGATVGAGQSFLLRWVDDNAAQTSPDQIIGLNNVSVTAVPEPGSLALLLAGVGVLGWLFRKQQA